METVRTGTSQALNEVVGHILSLDRKMDKLHERGRHPGDPEWQRCDELLTEIGVELYTDGGEARMRAALDRAHTFGLRGRYVERQWSGIGAWTE